MLHSVLTAVLASGIIIASGGRHRSMNHATMDISHMFFSRKVIQMGGIASSSVCVCTLGRTCFNRTVPPLALRTEDTSHHWDGITFQLQTSFSLHHEAILVIGRNLVGSPICFQFCLFSISFSVLFFLTTLSSLPAKLLFLRVTSGFLLVCLQPTCYLQEVSNEGFGLWLFRSLLQRDRHLSLQSRCQ